MSRFLRMPASWRSPREIMSSTPCTDVGCIALILRSGVSHCSWKIMAVINCSMCNNMLIKESKTETIFKGLFKVGKTMYFLTVPLSSQKQKICMVTHHFEGLTNSCTLKVINTVMWCKHSPDSAACLWRHSLTWESSSCTWMRRPSALTTRAPIATSNSRLDTGSIHM